MTFARSRTGDVTFPDVFRVLFNIVAIALCVALPDQAGGILTGKHKFDSPPDEGRFSGKTVWGARYRWPALPRFCAILRFWDVIISYFDSPSPVPRSLVTVARRAVGHPRPARVVSIVTEISVAARTQQEVLGLRWKGSRFGPLVAIQCVRRSMCSST